MKLNTNGQKGLFGMKNWLEAAMLEAQEYRRNLVRKGELLDSQSFCHRSGMDEAELKSAMPKGRLFGLEVDGVIHFPAFFAESLINRDWLEEATLLMGNLDGGQKWAFFTTPKGSLGGITPLEALRQGRFEAVFIAAKGFAEQ